jgi:hypothetical protein
MSSKHSAPKKFHHMQTPAQPSLLEGADDSARSLEVKQFYQLLLHLVATLSKESSNNVALVIGAAIFFGFAVFMAARPLGSCNPLPGTNIPIKVESNPTTTVDTQQNNSQHQRLPDTQQMIENSPSGS